MFYNSEMAYNFIFFFLLLPHANVCRGLHGQFRSGKEQQQHSARKTLKSCAVFSGVRYGELLNLSAIRFRLPPVLGHNRLSRSVPFDV